MSKLYSCTACQQVIDKYVERAEKSQRLRREHWDMEQQFVMGMD